MKTQPRKNQIMIRPNHKPLVPCLAILVSAVSLPDAHAANGTWTQNATGSLWSTTTNWSGSTVADGSGFTANFNTLDLTADNTVRLDSDRTLTNLTFGDTNTATAAGWTLDNNGTATNNLILAGTTPTVTVNGLGTGKTVTISAIIEGTQGLTKAGNGTLTLSGVNTYSGASSISAGILSITGNNSLGAAGSGNGTTVSNNAALRLDASGLNITESLTVQGDGSNFTGALFNNSGNNTYSGLITVGAAGARIGANNNTTLNLTGGVSSSSGGSLALRPGGGGAIQITTTALTLNANTLFIYETGNVTLGVAGSSFGTVTPGWQGTLKAGAANVLPSNSTLSLGVTGGVQAGTGTFDLAGFAQTIGGIRTTASVTEGTRTVTNSSGTAATLTVNQSSNTTYDGRFTGALALTKQGAGILTLSGSTANTFTGLTTVSGGTLELNKTAGVNAIAGDGNTTTNDVRVDTGATLKHLAANQISDNATVNLNAGTWNLNGANETVRNLNAAVVSGAGPTLTLGTNSTLTLNRIDWDNTGSQLTSNIGGNNTGASAGTIRFVADGATQAVFDANYAGTLNVNSAVQIDATSLTIRSSTWGTNLKGQISGTGKIIFDPTAGGGELILENGANNYSGGTQWISDTGASGAWERLTVTASGALGSGNVTIQGGNQNTWVSGFSGTPTAFVFTNNTNHSNNFILSGNSTISVSNPDGATASSETVSLSGNFSLDSNTLFVRGRGNGTISGVISGTGGITKIDNPGTWILAGTNTYNGTTTVSAGTLRAGAAAGGQAFGNGSAVTLANVTGASLDLNGFSQTIGSLAGGGLTGGNVALGANATLTIGGNNMSTSYAGIISGTGTSGLTKTGSGMQTLTGNNTYSGGTTVSDGTLAINGSVAGAVDVNSGATLQGSGSIGGALSVSGQLSPGNSIESLGASSISFLNGSSFAYELNSSGVLSGDLLYTTGALNIATTTTLSLSDLLAGTLAMDSKLTLISYGTWTGGLFTYNGSTLDNGAKFTLGSNEWLFKYDDTTGGSNFSSDQTGAAGYVTMTVVPEPNVVMVAGSLALMALLRRRRD